MFYDYFGAHPNNYKSRSADNVDDVNIANMNLNDGSDLVTSDRLHHANKLVDYEQTGATISDSPSADKEPSDYTVEYNAELEDVPGNNFDSADPSPPVKVRYLT